VLVLKFLDKRGKYVEPIAIVGSGISIPAPFDFGNGGGESA
jgi:hypothetical protein